MGLDFFQDFLLEVENEPLEKEVATTSDKNIQTYEKVKLTVQGVLGCLTGQMHKSVNGAS